VCGKVVRAAEEKFARSAEEPSFQLRIRLSRIRQDQSIGSDEHALSRAFDFCAGLQTLHFRQRTVNFVIVVEIDSSARSHVYGLLEVSFQTLRCLELGIAFTTIEAAAAFRPIFLSSEVFQEKGDANCAVATGQAEKVSYVLEIVRVDLRAGWSFWCGDSRHDERSLAEEVRVRNRSVRTV
jgi:hypothetical protein